MAGTACGGMDQTISITGEMNSAKLIDFIPSIKATNVTVPNSVALVIANSLTPSPKLLTLGTRYNKRVVECRFGLAIMALKLGKCATFMDLQHCCIKVLPLFFRATFMSRSTPLCTLQFQLDF